MRVYLACGLTHVPRDSFAEYVAFIHSLAASVTKTLGAKVLYALKDSDPQLAEKPPGDRPSLCYLWDRRMIETADTLVAEATFPSTGLGIELQIASTKGIPVILTFDTADHHRATPASYSNPDHTQHQLQVGDGYISLMALGLPGVFRVVPYASSREGIPAIINALKELQR